MKLIRQNERLMQSKNVFIPRLESAVKFITFRLEEMERDTFAMLKTVKRKMEEREKKCRGGSNCKLILKTPSKKNFTILNVQ